MNQKERTRNNTQVRRTKNKTEKCMMSEKLKKNKQDKTIANK